MRRSRIGRARSAPESPRVPCVGEAGAGSGAPATKTPIEATFGQTGRIAQRRAMLPQQPRSQRGNTAQATMLPTQITFESWRWEDNLSFLWTARVRVAGSNVWRLSSNTTPRANDYAVARPPARMIVSVLWLRARMGRESEVR